MRNRVTLALVLACSLPLAGCATARSAPGSFDQSITLRVANHSGARISVSAIWARGQPVYVGDVRNRGERSFTVSYVRAADLQVTVEFADGGQVMSTRLSMDPDETALLRIGVDRIPHLERAEP